MHRADVNSGACLALAVAALFGVHFALHPQLAYPTMGLLLLLLRQRLTPWARIVIVSVAALSAWRGQHAMQSFLERRLALYHATQAVARCHGVGEIVQSPLLRAGKFVLVVDAQQLECDAPVSGTHRLRLAEAGVVQGGGFARGDLVDFVAQIGPVAPFRQIELNNPIPRLASLGVVASGAALSVERIREGTGWRHAIDVVRNHVRARISATYALRAEALGRALVLGENDLEPEEQHAFQRSGLSHLLAVSGTHLVFAVVSLVAALRALLLRCYRIASTVDLQRWVAPFGVVLALGYADFAGGSGSAWRAAWMLSAVYLARMCGRRLGGLRALAYSILLGVCYDPLAGYDVSFLLSALATVGLIVIAPTIKRPIARIRWRPARWLWEALATTMAAMLPCVPLLLLIAPDVTWAGMLANVIAGPVGELAALPLCLLHATMWPLALVERGLALAGSGALLMVGAIARVSAGIEWARVALPPPTNEQIHVLLLGVAAMATSAAAWGRSEPLPDPVGAAGAANASRSTAAGDFGSLHAWLWRATWTRANVMRAITAPALRASVLPVSIALTTLAAVMGLERAATLAGAPRGKLRVTALDVGQGDSLLVDLPDGKLMLIDGGGAITAGVDPGERVILPLLRARRRDHIDIAVLTHPHPDHFGGLLTVLRALPVREFWEAGDAEPRETTELGKLRLDLLAKGTVIRHLPELCRDYAVQTHQIIGVLGPCPEPVAGHHANDQSIAIRLQFGRHSALLPGDAESLEESELVASHGASLHADLLKLGHHGSRTSTSPAWLAAVRPALAVVSAGLRNRFGHPHPTTLSRLHAAHVPLYRTDHLGSFEWSSDGEHMQVRTAATDLVSLR
jgi:competence protein ComEC